MEDLFLVRENTHNVWNFQIICNVSKKKVRYRFEMVKYITQLPEMYKTTTSLNSFRNKIKTWKCETCVCQLCQTYHQNLGFL